MDTDFQVVAERLCRIRSGDDLVEELPPVDADGFLQPSGLLLSPNGPLTPGGLIAPEDIAVHALVLLGEPGIGKSTAFEGLLAGLPADRLVRVDGASLTDSSFHDLIGRHLETVVAPRPSEREGVGSSQPPITIVIDQLDESPMIRRFPQAFDRACRVNRVDGLRVYVACRAADYPVGLTRVLANVCGGCTVADLAPLTRPEAERLADSIPGVDGAALVDAAVDAGAGALASVPLTLGLLARTFLREGGALAGGSIAIFAKAVDQLLAPHADSTHPPMSSSLDQRRAIAGRAAALLLLSGRRTIWAGSPLRDGPQDLREDALVGGTEQVVNGSFEVVRQFVIETVSSALFAARGANRTAFRHGSIAAYLAAQHIAGKNMAREQLESLFLVAGPDDVRSIPTSLRETAAWLVSFAPEQSSWLVHADPESFVAHSRVVELPAVRAAIVDALLTRAPEIELGELPWRHSRWELAHPDLGSQLSGTLAHEEQPNDWETLARVRLAVRLAEQTRTTELLEPLIRLVENGRWGAPTRAQAARAAMRIGADGAAPRMIAVLESLRLDPEAAMDDPDDELLGTLLDALYPRFLDLTQVLPHLHRRQNPNLFGMYMGFLVDFPKRLPDDALEEILDWVAGKRLLDDDDEIEVDPAELAAPYSVRERSEVPIDIVFGVLDRATTVANATEHLDRVAVILGPLLFGHRQPPLPVGLTLIDNTGALTPAARTLSRLLALSLAEVRIAPEAALERADAWEIVHGWSSSPEWRSDAYVPEGATRSNRSSLLDTADLGWLYDAITERAEGGAARVADLLTEVANQLFDILDDASTSYVYERQSHPAWSVLRSRFDPVPLDSEYARMMRRHRKRRGEEHQTRSDQEVEAAVGKLGEQLDAAAAGDTEAFWRFTYACQADPRTGTSRQRFADDITKLPGFQALGQTALELYNAASLRYLTHEHDHGESWLGTGQFDWRAWAGFLALATLDRAGMLDEVPDTAWKHWTSAVLWFPAWEEDPIERKAMLLARCALHAERSLAAALSEYTVGEVNRGSVPDLRGVPFASSALRDKGLELLGTLESSWRDLQRTGSDPTPSEGNTQALLSAWSALVEGLGRVVPEAVNARLLKLLDDPDPALAPLASTATVAMYAVDPVGTWHSLVITGIVGGQQLAELAGSLGYARGADALTGLSAVELAKSYELLSQVLPPEEDRHISGAHWISSDEQARRLRDELITVLAAQGTEEAVLELARLAAAHPERLMIRSALLRARVARFATAWIPPLPDEVARLMANIERRLVRSDEELLQLVLRTLRTIERECRGHADLLWDRVPKRFLAGRLDADGWLPKPEAALSGYVAHELTIRLHGRGMAVNREVLVRPTDAYGAGERTDILVEALTGSIQQDDFRPTRLALVIEVKGAWNRGLMTEQRSQLAERYLPEVNTRVGIYLVGWFPPEQWAAIREPGRGRAAALRPAKLDTTLREQAVGIRKDLGRVVVPVRMVFDRPARALSAGTGG